MKIHCSKCCIDNAGVWLDFPCICNSAPSPQEAKDEKIQYACCCICHKKNHPTIHAEDDCLGCHTLPEDNPFHTHNSKAKDDWKADIGNVIASNDPVALKLAAIIPCIENLLTQQKEELDKKYIKWAAEYAMAETKKERNRILACLPEESSRADGSKNSYDLAFNEARQAFLDNYNKMKGGDKND